METARRQVDHDRANRALQDITLKRNEVLLKDQWVPAQTVDQNRADAAVAGPMSALRKRTAPWPLTKLTSPPRPWRKQKHFSPIRRLWRRSMAWWRGV